MLWKKIYKKMEIILDKKAYVKKELIVIGPNTTGNGRTHSTGYVAYWGPQKFEGSTRKLAITQLVNFLRSKHGKTGLDNIFELPAVDGLDEDHAIYIPSEILELEVNSEIDFSLITQGTEE